MGEKKEKRKKGSSLITLLTKSNVPGHLSFQNPAPPFIKKIKNILLTLKPVDKNS